MSTIHEQHTAGERRAAADGRSFGDLVKEFRDEITRLLRQEVLLAQTEMRDKARVVARNSIYLAIGGAVAYAGLIFIILSFCALAAWGLYAAGLSGEMSLWLGTLIVGLAVTVIGYVLIQKGISTLKRQTFVPEKTVTSLQEDAAWIRNKVA